jgi:hypothetical protein
VTEHRWDFGAALDDAAFVALDFDPALVDPALTDFVADACRDDDVVAGPGAAVPLRLVTSTQDRSALLTVQIDRVAAMGVEPAEAVNWAIEANGIAPEWAIKDGVLDLLLHISQPAVRAGDLFLVQVTTQDAEGEATSDERRLVLVRESAGRLQAQLSYRPVAAEVVIAKVLAGPLSLDHLTEEQAQLVPASVEESRGPNALAWYERLASGPDRP